MTTCDVHETITVRFYAPSGEHLSTDTLRLVSHDGLITAGDVLDSVARMGITWLPVGPLPAHHALIGHGRMRTR